MSDCEMAVLVLVVLSIAQAISYLQIAALPLSHWHWQRGFRAAFEEWANSNDWEGYPEVPAVMYDDLVRRLENFVAGHDQRTKCKQRRLVQ